MGSLSRVRKRVGVGAVAPTKYQRLLLATRPPAPRPAPASGSGEQPTGFGPVSPCI
ncbi:hypothetical protein CBM2629_B10183 [Cupriavidus taiwanensis]|nr:hypothetical protein CBM2629_B10183 [Cupriavidus taiwanensis]